jgi:hypothetical protein
LADDEEEEEEETEAEDEVKPELDPRLPPANDSLVDQLKTIVTETDTQDTTIITPAPAPDPLLKIQTARKMISEIAFVKLHSDIVRSDPFDDYFICFANQTQVRPKKYKWNNTSKTITVWFTDIDNNPMLTPSFHIDLLLMY